MRALQSGGASAGAGDAAGLTPLMAVAKSAGSALTVAQERELAAVLRSLVGAGAEVDARDAHGRTALHRALGAGNLAAARALLLSGASLAAVSPADGYSGSDLVFSMGARGAALVQWLADAGKLPDVNARNSRGLAPIHIAVFTARKGDLALVEKLVQLGAGVTEKDASGRTVLNHIVPRHPSRQEGRHRLLPRPRGQVRGRLDERRQQPGPLTPSVADYRLEVDLTLTAHRATTQHG